MFGPALRTMSRSLVLRHLRLFKSPAISQLHLRNSQQTKTFATQNSSENAFAQAMRDQQQQKGGDPEQKEGDQEKDGKDKDSENDSEEKPPKSTSKSWAFGLGLLVTYIYLGQSFESPDIEGENIFTAHNRRCKESLIDSYQYFFHPPSKTLLPPLPPQMYRSHTLCIELNDTLTHLVWDKDMGWRLAIRPHAKLMMYILHQFYELVVFTNSPSHLASPVIDTLDNLGVFHYRLYREHHRLDNDKYLKDLSFLARDLKTVIAIDPEADTTLSCNPENALKIKAWHGEKGDKELQRWTVFLVELMMFAVQNQVEDLRPLLMAIKSNDSEDVPHGWQMHKDKIRETIRNTAAAPAAAISSASTNTTNSPTSWITATLQTLVGKGGVAAKVRGGYGDATPLDRLEQYCAEMRSQMEKEYAGHMKNVESSKREQEAQIVKQMDEMKKGDFKLIDFIMGNVPQPGAEPVKKAE